MKTERWDPNKDLSAPLRWRKPRRVEVTVDFAAKPEVVAAVFGVMAAAPSHLFAVTATGAEDVEGWLEWVDMWDCNGDGYPDALRSIRYAAECSGGTFPASWEGDGAPAGCDWPLPNVILTFGATDQASFDAGWGHAQKWAADGWKVGVHFDGLTGAVRVLSALMSGRRPGDCANCGQGHGFSRCPNYGGVNLTIEPEYAGPDKHYKHPCAAFRRAVCDGLSWVTVSGGADPVHPAWVRSLLDQCAAANVPFRFTGWGEWRESLPEDVAKMTLCVSPTGGRYHPGAPHPGGCVFMAAVGRSYSGRLLDGVVHDEWPEVSA